MFSKLFLVTILLCTSLCLATDPTITSVEPILSTTGPTDITIFGSNFEPLLLTIESINVDGIDCCDVNILSDSAITCTAKQGLGQDQRVSIVTSTGTIWADIVDYELATISACNEAGDVTVGTSAIYVTICGTNFGLPDHTTDLDEWSGRLNVVVVGGFEATLVSHSDSQIVVTLPENGAGRLLPVRLELGSQALVVPGITVSFPAPIVTSISVDKTQKRTANWISVIIHGIDFGTPSPLLRITASIGSFPCVNLHHISAEEIRCSVSGVGANQGVVVIVNGQSSAIASGSTGVPTVRFDFPNTATAGLTCVPPFGAQDYFNSDMCNCWSGSAPSNNLLSTDCDVHAVCPGRLTTQPVVAESAPSRPITEFKDDKLWIKQTIPIVKNRRDTIIQFVVPKIASPSPATDAGTIGSQTCFFPGTLWSKKVNSLDCLDEFYGVLPWSQNVLCGFVEDTSYATSTVLRVFKTNLVTSYTETFKKSDGSIYFRKVSNSFLISVSFTRQIVALTKTPVTVIIADEKAPTSLDVVVNGDALYDVASKKTIIEFETTIAWPYKVDDLVLAAWWKQAVDNSETNPLVASAQLTVLQPGEYECDQVEDTTCEQAWVLTIDTHPGAADPAACNIKGQYVFNTGNLLCRDYTTVDTCKENPWTNFTILIGKTDLCDDAPDTDASKGLTTSLESFYDADLAIPQSIFQTGDMVYFKLIVNDPSSTIDTITFNKIDVTSSTISTDTNPLYLLGAGDSPLTADFFYSDAEFNITSEFRQPFLTPGTDGNLQFNFRLLRKKLLAIGTLSSQTSDDLTRQLTVSAVIDILYHGNQKRTVTLSNTLPAVAHSQISFYDMEDTNEDLAPHNNDAVGADADAEDAMDLFASPATMLVASVAAVAGVAALVLA